LRFGAPKNNKIVKSNGMERHLEEAELVLGVVGRNLEEAEHILGLVGRNLEEAELVLGLVGRNLEQLSVKCKILPYGATYVCCCP
jgi:hypothetical protein